MPEVKCDSPFIFTEEQSSYCVWSQLWYRPPIALGYARAGAQVIVASRNAVNPEKATPLEVCRSPVGLPTGSHSG